jgi:hypothetical protein
MIASRALLIPALMPGFPPNVIDGGVSVLSSAIVPFGKVASWPGVMPNWICAERTDVLLLLTPTLIVPQLPGFPEATG